MAKFDMTAFIKEANANCEPGFTVSLFNFGTWLNDGQPFANFDDALAAAKKAHFEADIYDRAVRVARWSPITGTTLF